MSYAGHSNMDEWERQAAQMLPPLMAFDFRLMYEFIQKSGLKRPPPTSTAKPNSSATPHANSKTSSRKPKSHSASEIESPRRGARISATGRARDDQPAPWCQRVDQGGRA